MALPAGSLGKSRAALASPYFPDMARNFSAQVDLYKQLALSSWDDAPPEEKKRQAEAIAALGGLDSMLKAELGEFSKRDFTRPAADLDDRVAAIAVFMYLLDKTREMHAAALKKNKIGLYSLFGSVMKSLLKLSNGYFRKPLLQAVKDYLADEPLFAACAELSGVELVALQDMVPIYQPKLSDRVAAMLEPKGNSKKK